MQRHTLYLYLETALCVSGGTSTNHQKRIQLYLQHVVFVTQLLIPASYRGRVGSGLSVLWVAYSIPCPENTFRTVGARVQRLLSQTWIQIEIKTFRLLF
jgi:hypothetical protein